MSHMLSVKALVRPPTHRPVLPSDIGRFLEDTRDRFVQAPAAVTSVSVTLHLPHEQLIAELMSRVEAMARREGLAHHIHLIADRCEVRFTRKDGPR
jgi:hypothetical protein